VMSLAAACLLFSMVPTLVGAVDEPPAGTLIPSVSLSVENGAVAGWDLGESATVDGSDIKLIDRTAKTKGTIWTSQQCHADQWEASFQLTINGDAENAGKGLGFWYTTSVMKPGILFGSDERYEGFGLLFDSYDDDGKNDNPIIMGWINDGTKVFNHDTDGLGTRFGGCRAKYRNRGNKVGVKVTYQHDSLKVLLDMRNNGVWERCLVKDNIYLSAGSYFGFSAANMAETPGDEVRLHNLKVYDLETKESIKKEEEELAKKEEEEKKARTGSGEIHDLAEQMSGIQKDLHEEFLQKISDMIQRDHVTASHEFRAIRSQLSDTLESAAQPKEALSQLKDTIGTLSTSLDEMKKDLQTLKSGSGGGNNDEVKKKLDSFQNDIANVKRSVENQMSQQRNAKAELKQHMVTVSDAVEKGGGGASWSYVLLFQLLFVVALVLYRRSGSGEAKQHLV